MVAQNGQTFAQVMVPTGPAAPAVGPAGETPRIVLFGLFGTGNLGNDATLLATLHQLRRRLPQAQVRCVCNRIPAEAARYGLDEQLELELEPVPVRGRWRIGNARLRDAYAAAGTLLLEPLRRFAVRQHFRAGDVFIVVGTGALDDFGAQPWDMPAWLLRWCRGARQRGATVGFLSVGAGPIHARLNRWLMLRAVETAHWRSYRDTVSYDFLGRHGVEVARDVVLPDLVFALPPPARAADPDGADDRSAVVGLGVMGYYGWKADQTDPEGQAAYRRYLATMAAFARWLLERGHPVRLLVGEPPVDEPVRQDLIAQLRHDLPSHLADRITCNPITEVAELFDEIGRTDVVVASRFHNIVCALSLGRPAVSIGYAAKFEAIMADAGLAGFSQSIDAIDLPLLQRQFERLLSERADLEERIRRRVEAHRLELERYFDGLFGPGVT